MQLPGGETRARLVLLASGLSAAVEFGSRPAPRSRVGLGAHLPASDAAAFDPAGSQADAITMLCGPEGYVGLVRDEGGRLNVAAAVDPEELRRLGGQELVARLLARSGLQALPPADWHGTPPLTRKGPVVAERVLALGDAAGYVEPFTGEGIGWALATARAVVPFAMQGWSEAMHRLWPREVQRAVRSRTCRATAAVLRHPRLLGSLLPLLAAAPGLAAPLIRGTQRP